jgi:hypothetical protein
MEGTGCNVMHTKCIPHSGHLTQLSSKGRRPALCNPQTRITPVNANSTCQEALSFSSPILYHATCNAAWRAQPQARPASAHR